MDYDPDSEIKKWEATLKLQGGHEIAFADSDEERVSILSKRIAEAYNSYNESYERDEPYADRFVSLTLSNVDQLEKLRKKYRGNILLTFPKTETTGRINDSDIERARTVDLATLVEPDKTGRIVCPFHPDQRPSMWIKNGFGFCFSCGAHCDAIRWMSDVEGLGFIEAVRRLAR